MVKKLTLLLTAAQRRWKLPYKAVLWTLSLGAVVWSGFHFLWLLVFVFVSIGAYVTESRERAMLRTSYWFLVALSPLLLWLQASSFIPLIASPGVRVFVVAALGVLFWAMLNLMRFAFSDRLFAYNLVNTAILVVLFLTTFHMVQPYYMGVIGIGLFAAITLLFKELYGFFGITQKKSWVISVVIGLIALELAWFVLLLPLGILNTAAFLVLFLVLVRDILLSHLRGDLSTAFVFRQFTFLVLLTIIIFAASQWTL